MAVLISKIIQHKHSGSGGPCYLYSYPIAQCPVGGYAHGHYGYLNAGSPCNVCGATLVGTTAYDCTCKASKCCTVNIDYDYVTVEANVVKANDDSGLNNIKYKWYHNDNLISEEKSFMPTADGDYKLVISGNDGKTNEGKSETITFKVDYVNSWDDFCLGDLKIRGMALGDRYISEAALGDKLLK